MKRTLALLAVVMLLISAASCACASPVLSDNFIELGEEEQWVMSGSITVDEQSVQAGAWNMTRDDNGGIDDKVVDALGDVSVFGGFGFQPSVAETFSGTTLQFPLTDAGAANLPQSFSAGIAQQVLKGDGYGTFEQVLIASSASHDANTLTLVLPQEYVIDSAIYWVYFIEGGSTPVAPDSSTGGGSGGCSAGFGALALLAAVPLFARRKK